MPLLRQYDREGWKDSPGRCRHLNMSRITISRPMIRLRLKGRTNDRLRLSHLSNHMITAEDTTRSTPGLATVRIAGKTT